MTFRQIWYHDIMQFPVSNLSEFRSPPRIQSHPEKRERRSRLSALQDMCTWSDSPHKRRLHTVPAATLHSLHRHDMNVRKLIHLRPSGHLYEFSAAARPRQPEAQPCLTQAADIHPLTSTHIKHSQNDAGMQICHGLIAQLRMCLQSQVGFVLWHDKTCLKSTIFHHNSSSSNLATSPSSTLIKLLLHSNFPDLRFNHLLV